MHWSLGTQIQKKEREKEGIIKEKKETEMEKGGKKKKRTKQIRMLQKP